MAEKEEIEETEETEFSEDISINDLSADEVPVSQKLSQERERQNLTLKQVSERTRLPVRHLASLEAGDYDALPGTTYALGFARSFARSLKLNENDIVGQLRKELSFQEHYGRHFTEEDIEASNPGRIPPKFFTWGAIAVLVILLILYAILRQDADEPDMPIAQEPAESAIAEQPAAAEQTPATGPVVLTATEDVWLRVYERDGDRLFEDRLSAGNSYTVPEDATDPLILTGRPQALDVTVGGQAVPPLGEADYTISDMPVSAAALLARGEETSDEDAEEGE